MFHMILIHCDKHFRNTLGWFLSWLCVIVDGVQVVCHVARSEYNTLLQYLGQFHILIHFVSICKTDRTPNYQTTRMKLLTGIPCISIMYRSPECIHYRHICGIHEPPIHEPLIHEPIAASCCSGYHPTKSSVSVE